MKTTLPLLAFVGAFLFGGCCDRHYDAIFSYNDANGRPMDSAGPISNTKAVKTPIATIVTTRNGTVWEVSILPTRVDSYGNFVDATHYENNRRGVATYRFSAVDDMRQIVVPLQDGSITLAYARVGWSVAELRIVVADTKAAVIHNEVLR